MVSQQGGEGVMFRKHDVVGLRARMGLSQEKFAKKLGVSVSAVGKWETGGIKRNSGFLKYGIQ